MAAMPTPDLAVPYEAPRQVKTMAAVQPMAPKKGCMQCQHKDVRDGPGSGSNRRGVPRSSLVGVEMTASTGSERGSCTDRVHGAAEKALSAAHPARTTGAWDRRQRAQPRKE